MDNNNPVTSDDPDSYRALAGRGTSELKVEGSRFLGYARPVDTEEQAEAFVEQLRSEHHDARHVCYGLRVGLGAQRIDRSNDDGEPPRTGGFPIWQVLSGEELENSLVVVVRYFGGTKLGMGGLKRAYRDAAKAAIEAADTTVHHPETRLDVTIPYSLYDEFEHLIGQLEPVRITDRDFGADITASLAIWTSNRAEVCHRLGNFLGRSPDEVGSRPDDE